VTCEITSESAAFSRAPPNDVNAVHRKRRVSPAQRRKGEERAATSKTRRRRSDTSGTRFIARNNGISEGECPKCRFTVHPGARSSRPVPHSPPALARSGHPVGCHAARDFAPQRASVARRAARQPTAWPSARPTGAVAAPPGAWHVSAKLAQALQRSVPQVTAGNSTSLHAKYRRAR